LELSKRVRITPIILKESIRSNNITTVTQDDPQELFAILDTIEEAYSGYSSLIQEKKSTILQN
jgi:hypothetical protein